MPLTGVIQKHNVLRAILHSLSKNASVRDPLEPPYEAVLTIYCILRGNQLCPLYTDDTGSRKSAVFGCRENLRLPFIGMNGDKAFFINTDNAFIRRHPRNSLIGSRIRLEQCPQLSRLTRKHICFRFAERHAGHRHLRQNANPALGFKRTVDRGCADDGFPQRNGCHQSICNRHDRAVIRCPYQLLIGCVFRSNRGKQLQNVADRKVDLLAVQRNTFHGNFGNFGNFVRTERRKRGYTYEKGDYDRYERFNFPHDAPQKDDMLIIVIFCVPVNYI